MSINRKKLRLIILAIVLTMSTVVSARIEGGFNNPVPHNLNNNIIHNPINNDGYNNNFYNRHYNNNGEVILPDDGDNDSSCQSTQVCDSSGNCVTQQSCN